MKENTFMESKKGRDRKFVTGKISKIQKGKPIGKNKVGERNNGIKNIIRKNKV